MLAEYFGASWLLLLSEFRYLFTETLLISRFGLLARRCLLLQLARGFVWRCRRKDKIENRPEKIRGGFFDK